MSDKPFRPREIRRLIDGVVVIAKSDGCMDVRPTWKKPAGGYFTRARVAKWIADTLNGKLRARSRAPADSDGERE